jgi:hypothetical protein
MNTRLFVERDNSLPEAVRADFAPIVGTCCCFRLRSGPNGGCPEHVYCAGFPAIYGPAAPTSAAETQRRTFDFPCVRCENWITRCGPGRRVGRMKIARLSEIAAQEVRSPEGKYHLLRQSISQELGGGQKMSELGAADIRLTWSMFDYLLVRLTFHFTPTSLNGRCTSSFKVEAASAGRTLRLPLKRAKASFSVPGNRTKS